MTIQQKEELKLLARLVHEDKFEEALPLLRKLEQELGLEAPGLVRVRFEMSLAPVEK